MSWAITGMGAVSSIGGSVGEIFVSLCAGRSGLAPLRGFDRSRFRAGHAYEIDDRPAPGSDVPLRATRWLGQAVEAALLDAGLPMAAADVPVLVGTTLRELRSVELRWRDGHAFDLTDLHFGRSLRARFGAATTYTICNACAASLYALAMGADLLDAGVADAVVVAGVDSITESSYGLLDRVNAEPPEALRPFDRDRRGMLMGEGAVAVVLRRTEDVAASQRQALLRAVSVSCDAYHPTAPDPKGIALAIREAHERAGVCPDDIELILLHGSGTLLNDEAEATAVSEVFAGTAVPYLTAIKSMTGHTAGGSGLLSLVVAVESLKSGRVPPTIGLDNPIDPAAQLPIVRGEEATADVRLAQVNAFGFGGVNAVAVVEKAA